MEGLQERSSKFSFVAGSLLVSLMLACVLIGLLQLGLRLDPGWNGGYLPWWGLLVALEAIYSTLVIRRLAYTGLDWLRMRLVELVVLILALKTLQFLLFVPPGDWLEASTWRAGSLFDGTFWLGFVLTVFIWITAANFAEDLIQICRTGASRKNEVASLNAEDRIRARRRLVDKVLVLGALLMALTAFSRIDVRLLWGDRAPVDASYANLLLFFVLALALFSQTQLATLNALWQLEGIAVRREVAARWLRASLLFLIVLAGLVWFIPTFYADSLLQGLQAILGHLINLVWAMWGLFGYLLVTLAKLLGALPFQAPEEEGAAPRNPISPPDLGAAAPIAWLETLKSVLFWAILLGVIAFSVYQYLQQNQELWPKLQRIPFLAWLADFWRWFRDRLAGARRAAQSTVARIQARLAPRRAAGLDEKGWRFTNPRRLTPRQQVLFYFLATIQKGEQAGVLRGQAQTPHEYARLLEDRFPESEMDLTPLTESFVEARYSRHPIAEDRGIQARHWWQGLRKLLSRKRASG